MSRFELYSPEGLRVDGRRWNELRSFECKINTHPVFDGSSYVEHGNSKVICMVKGPMEPRQRSQVNQTQVVIEMNLNIASFSSLQRRIRNKSDKRIIEMKTTLERTFEQSVMSHLYPRTLIEVDVQVLAQDGGILATMTNAITLALIDAGISMYDHVSAISVGIHDQTPLLDLNVIEENEMSCITIGVVGKSEKLAMLLLEDKMPLDKLESVLGVAIAGGHRIRDMMDEQVRSHGNQRVAKISNSALKSVYNSSYV